MLRLTYQKIRSGSLGNQFVLIDMAENLDPKLTWHRDHLVSQLRKSVGLSSNNKIVNNVPKKLSLCYIFWQQFEAMWLIVKSSLNPLLSTEWNLSQCQKVQYYVDCRYSTQTAPLLLSQIGENYTLHCKCILKWCMWWWNWSCFVNLNYPNILLFFHQFLFIQKLVALISEMQGCKDN